MSRKNIEPLVLSMSRHSSVLASRNAVLQSAGFSVLATMDAAEFARLLGEHRVGLVVLCDSIREEERHTLAQQARQLAPAARILMVYRTGESSPFTGLADAYLGSLDGPQALIEAARRLSPLRESAQADD